MPKKGLGDAQRHIHNYFLSSTLHGVRYIADRSECYKKSERYH